jgi:hypothetical protein
MKHRPIIFIHHFNHSYLPLSLWQARKSNPDSEIILIGDGWNSHFDFLVEHVHASAYRKSADEFARHFQNFSTNPSDFERICIERWFILEEFMKARGIEQCLYLDSDILQFGNIEEDARRFSSFGMTVAGISGHSNFINRMEDLSEFCAFIRNAYTGENALQTLENKYKKFRETHEAGGISDMTFFTEYREEFPDRILDIGKPIEGMTYDIAMAYIEFSRNENGIKKVEKQNDGRLQVFMRGEGTVEMRSLHFQGEAKKYMKAHLFGTPLALEVIYRLNQFYLFGQKIWRKLFRIFL